MITNKDIENTRNSGSIENGAYTWDQLCQIVIKERDTALQENAELKRWRDAYRELAMRLFSYLEPGIYRIPATYGEEIDAEATKILEERGK